MPSDSSTPFSSSGRTVTSADDIAAVLHGRVTKCLNAAGGHQHAERVSIPPITWNCPRTVGSARSRPPWLR